MRITFGSVAAIAFSVAVCANCSKSGGEAQAEASAAPATEVVTAIGCPTPGPQPGCMTIKSKGKVYDIATISPPVDLSKGVGIDVRGRAGTESTACGLKFTEAKVEYLGIQCAAPPPVTPPA
jgi:hypothetical protein